MLNASIVLALKKDMDTQVLRISLCSMARKIDFACSPHIRFIHDSMELRYTYSLWLGQIVVWRVHRDYKRYL
jgi:hypothetical protein